MRRTSRLLNRTRVWSFHVAACFSIAACASSLACLSCLQRICPLGPCFDSAWCKRAAIQRFTSLDCCAELFQPSLGRPATTATLSLLPLTLPPPHLPSPPRAAQILPPEAAAPHPLRLLRRLLPAGVPAVGRQAGADDERLGSSGRQRRSAAGPRNQRRRAAGVWRPVRVGPARGGGARAAARQDPESAGVCVWRSGEPDRGFVGAASAYRLAELIRHSPTQCRRSSTVTPSNRAPRHSSRFYHHTRCGLEKSPAAPAS